MEKPILFSTPMIRAILAGNKSQTRRIVKGRPFDWIEHCGFTPEFVTMKENHLSPYGHKDDILWVRETWVWEGDTKYTDIIPVGMFFYKADFEENEGPTKWKPSIFMPREACRIRLKITDIKIQRLHDITDSDAIAEGTEMLPYVNNYVGAYQELWKDINGKESWNINPWVWVITFERYYGPVNT